MKRLIGGDLEVKDFLIVMAASLIAALAGADFIAVLLEILK